MNRTASKSNEARCVRLPRFGVRDTGQFRRYPPAPALDSEPSCNAVALPESIDLIIRGETGVPRFSDRSALVLRQAIDACATSFDDTGEFRQRVLVSFGPRLHPLQDVLQRFRCHIDRLFQLGLTCQSFNPHARPANAATGLVRNGTVRRPSFPRLSRRCRRLQHHGDRIRRDGRGVDLDRNRHRRVAGKPERHAVVAGLVRRRQLARRLAASEGIQSRVRAGRRRFERYGGRRA